MIEGMESIVATVSGYHGSERLKLIKLIAVAGANYVGKMSRSTTHLVCWKFKGSKYELAKKVGAVIVNHRWLEDCIREGKHMPEHPYTLRSGQEVGLIILNLPVHTETTGVLTENKLFLNKPNTYDHLKDVIDLDSDEIENDGWDDDWFLDENLFPRPGSSKKTPLGAKRKGVKQALREDCQAKANSRRSIREPYIPTINRLQRKSNGDISMVTDIPESSRRSRRLVKKNAKRNDIESPIIDPQRQNLIQADVDELTIASNLSEISNDKRDENEASISRRLEAPASSHGKHRDEDVNHSTKIPISVELSCVICWTEFSSTRGVLPCGHRFCFSCIQNWADHMVSNRKESTCPLCKASFASITRVDDAASLDQKIYSQTIPCASSTHDIFIVPEGGTSRSDIEIPMHSVCNHCQSHYPADLLIYCQTCQSSCVHSYCLDPPLFPWTCVSCRDRRLFYHS